MRLALDVAELDLIGGGSRADIDGEESAKEAFAFMPVDPRVNVQAGRAGFEDEPLGDPAEAAERS